MITVLQIARLPNIKVCLFSLFYIDNSHHVPVPWSYCHDSGCFCTSLLCICLWHLLGLSITVNISRKCYDCGKLCCSFFGVKLFDEFGYYDRWVDLFFFSTKKPQSISWQIYVFKKLFLYRLLEVTTVVENPFPCFWEYPDYLTLGVAMIWLDLGTFCFLVCWFLLLAGNVCWIR